MKMFQHIIFTLTLQFQRNITHKTNSAVTEILHITIHNKKTQLSLTNYTTHLCKQLMLM